MANSTEAYNRYLTQHREEHLGQLQEFLRIPSVSALSKHKEDVKRAAGWLADEMRRLKLENVGIIPTAGHPLVYGDWLHKPGLPTVLVYGHYDVQPVDPENLWDSPPFEPVIRGGQIYARGASDDKGPLLLHLKAVEALLAVDGVLPLNLKFLFEGEEEVGGEHLDEYIREHHDQLKTDVIVISDSPMFARGVPALCTGLRGLAALQVDVYGPSTDLHSGLYGGAVLNPVHALAQLLAGLHGPDGAVAVPGFYDAVHPVAHDELRSIQSLPFESEEFRKEVGAPALDGEAGYSVLERLWTRPTLEVNGFWGGFQGEGTKTIIPAEAHAKITCRLVPNQEPETVARLLGEHLRRQAPAGVRVEVQAMPGGKPSLMPHDSPPMTAAARALKASYGKEPVYIRMGGSIPVVQTFQDELQAPVALVGFSLPDEKFHAPNERFDLSNFDLGIRTICQYWHELADWKR